MNFKVFKKTAKYKDYITLHKHNYNIIYKECKNGIYKTKRYKRFFI